MKNDQKKPVHPRPASKPISPSRPAPIPSPLKESERREKHIPPPPPMPPKK